jgi:hypothetical protein
MGWVTFWAIFFTSSTRVDVLITIFCDFRQFSAKKLAFFSKTNVMIQILHNLAELFSEKNLKIITSVPGHTAQEQLIGFNVFLKRLF